MSLAIAELYTVRKFHKESSMKKPAAKPVVIVEGDEKIAMKSSVKPSGSRRFGRWFVGKPGMKKNSAKVSDPMAIE